MQPLDLLNAGVAVIPCAPKTKTPLVKWREYQQRLPTAAEFSRWFYPGNHRNAAAICGWNGLAVIDFDDTTRYGAWLAWCTVTGGVARRVAAETYRVRTARGVHVYLYVSEPTRCSHTEGIDVKAAGGYVLIPPSVHPSGAVYTALNEGAPILTVDALAQVLKDAPPPPAPKAPPVTNVAAASSLWPATPIDQILSAVPILSFFPGAIQSGEHWWMACCPFHDDRHESMWIDTERGLCGCYAGCTPKPLDALGLYARLHNMTIKAAVKEMIKEVV
jgi:hypothetical protein